MLSIIYFVTAELMCLSSLDVHSWAALGTGMLSFILFQWTRSLHGTGKWGQISNCKEATRSVDTRCQPCSGNAGRLSRGASLPILRLYSVFLAACKRWRDRSHHQWFTILYSCPPKQKLTGIIEATVRASVEELAYMNRIRFSTSSQNSIFDTDDPKSSWTSDENHLSVGSKRKNPRYSEDLRVRQTKWMVIADSSTAPMIIVDYDYQQRLKLICFISAEFETMFYFVKAWQILRTRISGLAANNNLSIRGDQLIYHKSASIDIRGRTEFEQSEMVWWNSIPGSGDWIRVVSFRILGHYRVGTYIRQSKIIFWACKFSWTAMDLYCNN